MTVVSNSFYIVGWARAIKWYMCKVHRSDCPVIKYLDYKVFINYQKMYLYFCVVWMVGEVCFNRKSWLKIQLKVWNILKIYPSNFLKLSSGRDWSVCRADLNTRALCLTLLIYHIILGFFYCTVGSGFYIMLLNTELQQAFNIKMRTELNV